VARRNEGLLDLLVEVPWWVSVALAAGVFVCLRFLIPGPPLFAWIALILLLAPAPVSAYREWPEGPRRHPSLVLATL
jgi:hypothetical protein